MSANGRRAVLLVTHPGRPDILALARGVAERLHGAGLTVRVLAGEAEALNLPWAEVVHPIAQHPVTEPGLSAETDPEHAAEIVLVLGGDGTFLRGAELARPSGAALLGVNLGRVAFLAEAEPEALNDTVSHIVEQEYAVEERMTLDVEVYPSGVDPSGGVGARPVVRTWALNEASLEKSSRERILEVVLAVDGHPLTSFGCDGLLCATPTGSTAYAFSAGGPIVWPDVEALLVVPNSAHALFARPLVTSPRSVITVEVADHGHGAVLCCDGRRTIPVDPGQRVLVRRGHQPVRVARVHPRPFGDRLVAKFQLPVHGFRDRRKAPRPADEGTDQHPGTDANDRDI